MSAFTKEEGRRFFAQLVVRELGMSTDEFLEKYHKGEFDEVDVDDMPGFYEVLALVKLVK